MVKAGGGFSSPMDIFYVFWGRRGKTQRERGVINVIHRFSVTSGDLWNGATITTTKNDSEKRICKRQSDQDGKKQITGMQIRIYLIAQEWFHKLCLCSWRASAIENR